MSIHGVPASSGGTTASSSVISPLSRSGLGERVGLVTGLLAETGVRPSLIWPTTVPVRPGWWKTRGRLCLPPPP